MAKWSAIPTHEVHNKRREWFDGDGRFHAQTLLQVDWDNRFKLVQDLYTSCFGGSPLSSPPGYTPRSYPGGSASGAGSPNMTRIGVTSVTLRDWAEVALARDIDLEVLDYKTSAFAEVQYGALYNIEETLDFAVEALTQTYRDFKWSFKINPKDLGFVHELQVPVVIINSMILQRKFIGLAPGNQALTPNFSTLFECINFTNHEAYTSNQLNKTFAAGTLLMLEPEVSNSIDMQVIDPLVNNNFGGKGFSVTARFLYRPGNHLFPEDTHNIWWRPRLDTLSGNSKGSWDRLLVKEESVGEAAWKPYEPFQRNPLIKSNWLIPATPPIDA